MNDCVSKF